VPIGSIVIEPFVVTVLEAGMLVLPVPKRQAIV